MCKASDYWKMTHKRLYFSTALLFALNINNHRCKIVEHNKCSDMANCSWTYSRRRVLLQEEIISASCSWTASITKEMPSELPFGCLWLKKWNIYVNKNRMFKASSYWNMTHKRLYLLTVLLLALKINNHRWKIGEHNKCSDMGNCLWTYISRRVYIYIYI